MPNLPDWLFGRTRSFLFGLTLPWTALRLILRTRRLLALSVLPVALTLILYFFVITRVQAWAKGELLLLFAQWGWSLDAWWTWILIGVARIGILILAAMTFSLMASVVASPFNDLLAEQAEKFASPPLPSPPRVAWLGKARLLWIDLGKSILAAIGSVLALLLSWMPAVNLMAFAISFLLIAFQYISYPQTRRNQGVGEGLRFLWRHAFACLGFGLTTSVIFTIPVVSAFFFPVAVVAGTLLYARASTGTLR